VPLVALKEDVFWLDVAMDDAEAMRDIQRPPHGCPNADGLL